MLKYKLSENVDSCISYTIVYTDEYERVLRELDFTIKKKYRNNMKKNWCKSNTCVETRQSCCAGLKKKSLHIPCYPRQQIRNQRPRHLHLVILQLHRQHLTHPTQLSTPKREIIYSLQPVHVRQPGPLSSQEEIPPHYREFCPIPWTLN